MTSVMVESIYPVFPDEILQLIQQQFNIILPSGYSFRMAIGGSAFPPKHPYEDVTGVGWWFAQYNSYGTMIELYEGQCFTFSTEVPSEAMHIDYSVYITMHTFPDWGYSPDDLAGIMIHEAVHAWQESIARNFVINPGQPDDPSSISWQSKYLAGMERQAIDAVTTADNTGRISISSRLRKELKNYKDLYDVRGTPDFPYLFMFPPQVP